MKRLINSLGGLLIMAALASCSKQKNDDISFVQTGTAPTDGDITLAITNDNSGNVTITPNGTGAATFDVYYGDATATPAVVQPGKNVTHSYAEGSYTVKVDAKSANGTVSTTTKPLMIIYRAPENVKISTNVNGRDLTITATALYASGGYKVYFGDVPNEVPTLMAVGASLTHSYAAIGSYTVKAEALSGGAATTMSASQVVKIFDALNLPLTFESATLDYSFTDFAGGATSVIDNPSPTGINTSGKVCKMIKYPGEVYGGSIKNLTSPIDFSSKKTIKIKVYSPRVGAKMLFKVQNLTDPNTAFEKEATTTKANAWEELVFDYSAIDASKSFQSIVIIFDNGTKGDGSPNFTYLFDDITLN